jgi:phospholipid transport system substrate-binding protein
MAADMTRFAASAVLLLALAGAATPALAGTATATATATASTAAQATAPDALIQELGNQATSISQDKGLSDAQRTEKFRAMLARHMDTEAMAQVALGRFWGKASEAERADYVTTYRDYLIKVYGRRLRDLGDSRVELADKRQVGADDVIVDTRLLSGSDVIPLSFRVLKRAGANLIIDVLAEGTSILVTQRDEFAAVIKTTGSVAGLTEKLKAIQ